MPSFTAGAGRSLSLPINGVAAAAAVFVGRRLHDRPDGGPARTSGLRAAVILLAGFAVPAAGLAEWRTLQRTTFCRDHQEFTSALARLHGETRAWWGVSDDGKAVVELHWSPESGSWTMLRVEHDGVACALAAGDSGALEFRGESEQP